MYNSKRERNNKLLKRAYIIVGSFSALVFGIVIISLTTGNGKSTPPPHYVASMKPDSMLVINPGDLRVYGQVKNTGKGAGTPSCTLQAHDAAYSYSGTDVVTKTSPLQPGATWNFADNLTITNQGASYITVVSVSCN